MDAPCLACSSILVGADNSDVSNHFLKNYFELTCPEITFWFTLSSQTCGNSIGAPPEATVVSTAAQNMRSSWRGRPFESVCFNSPR